MLKTRFIHGNIIITAKKPGSKGLLRILQKIYPHGPLNTGTLLQCTGTYHGSVDYCPKKMVEWGLVEERRHNTGISMIQPPAQALIIQLKCTRHLIVLSRSLSLNFF